MFLGGFLIILSFSTPTIIKNSDSFYFLFVSSFCYPQKRVFAFQKKLQTGIENSRESYKIYIYFCFKMLLFVFFVSKKAYL